MRFDRTRHGGPAASLLLVLAASTVVVQGSAAQSPAEDQANSLSSMLDLIRPKGEKEPDAIDYRPRAPLVVPPTRDLPEPKEAVRDPAWPKDPDANARRRAAIDSRHPVQKSSTAPDATPVPDEAKAPDPAKPAEHEGGCLLNGTGPQSCFHVLTSVFGGGASSEAAKPGVAPARKILTEPPAGYRAAVVVPKSAADKPKDEGGAFGGFLRALGIGKSDDK